MDRKLDIVLAAKDMTAKGFAAVQGRITAVGRSVLSLQGQLLTLAGVGGFGALVKSSLATVDSLAKTADKIGATTEGLAGLRHAAELTGVATNTMDMALQRMVRRVAEAARGTGEAKAAIAELGIDAKALAQLPVDRQFAIIADRMGRVEHQSDRVRLAFKLFDSEGVAVVNTLKLGSEGLRRTAEEAKALGLAVSRVDARRIEEANDAVHRLQGAAKGIGNTLAIALADPIAEIATNTTDWVKANDALIKQNVVAVIEGVGEKIKSIIGIYNAVPASIVEAPAAGIVGRILFGSWGPGKILAVMAAVNANMRELGMGAGSIVDSYRKLNDYMSKMGQVLRGERDWNTGKPTGANDALLGDLDAGRDSSAYVYRGGGENTNADQAILRSMGVDAATRDKIDDALDDYFQMYADFVRDIKKLNSDYLIARDQARGDYYFDPEMARFEGGKGQEEYAQGLIERYQKTGDALKDIAESTSYGMRGAFSEFLDATSDDFLKFEDLAVGVLRSVSRSLTDIAVSAGVNWLTSAITGALTGSAKGNVFSGGDLVPFAAGGIVSRPTVFPFASGIGLMGEAGPEAIMPLTRTPGGELGVRSEGGGVVHNHYYYISTLDAKSFEDKFRGSVERITADGFNDNNPAMWAAVSRRR